MKGYSGIPSTSANIKAAQSLVLLWLLTTACFKTYISAVSHKQVWTGYLNNAGYSIASIQWTDWGIWG